MCYFPTHPLPAVCLTTGSITGELYGNWSRTCFRGLTGSDVTSEGERAPSNPAFSAGKEALCSPLPAPPHSSPTFMGQIRDADVPARLRVELLFGSLPFPLPSVLLNQRGAQPTGEKIGASFSLSLSFPISTSISISIFQVLTVFLSWEPIGSP